MKKILENERRALVEDIGPWMNIRYAIYEKNPEQQCDVLEVWFSDKQKALDHWERVKDLETYRERRERERLELIERMKDAPDIYEDLPFM